MPAADGAVRVVGEFPATPEQVRFWFLDQLHPGSASSNICVMWELTGTFSVESVEHAFDKIIERHEIFRTRFVETDGQLTQQVLGDVTFGVGKIDVRHLPEPARVVRVNEIASQLSQEPFDTSEPCLFRITLIETAKDRATLVVVAHHMVFDGYSIRVLGRELGQLVDLIERNQAAELPELMLQYGDYALWREDCRTGESGADSIRFWRERLSDYQYFEIEADRSRSPLEQRAGGRMDLPLGHDFYDRLTRAANDASVTPFVFGCAVMASALYRASMNPDVSFGCAFAGRSAVELEELIGVFINPILLNIPLPDDPTFADALESASINLNDVLAHADLPFDEVVRCAQQQRDSTRTPLYSVNFGLQKVFLEEIDYGSVKIGSIPSVTPEITHDLSFQAFGRKSGWLLIVDYDRDRFDQATVQALGELMRECFEHAFLTPDAKIADVAFERPSPAIETAVREDIVVKRPTASIETQSRPEFRALVDTHQSEENSINNCDLRVREIWSDVLGIPTTSSDGNFFDLGGHSLLAMRLLSRVRTEFGFSPGIAEFLQTPTLEGIADCVSAGLRDAVSKQNGLTSLKEAKKIWNVITLGPGAKDSPLIVSVNQPFLFVPIARRVAGDMQVLNLHLNSQMVLREEVTRLDIDELATAAAAVIEPLVNNRPVILMGQCVDGTLALRIAQALEERTGSAAPLAMFDSWAPDAMDGMPAFRRMFIRARAKLRRLRHYIGRRLRGDIQWIEFFESYAISKSVLLHLGKIHPATSEEEAEWAINELLVSSMAEESFEPYSGETLVFKTESQTQRSIKVLFGWSKVLPADTSVFELKGWHGEALLGADVDRIVTVLKQRLARRAGSQMEPQSDRPKAALGAYGER